MKSYPNQNFIKVHRAPLGGNFLGINNDNWKNAARMLKAQAFMLYIYLVSNKDNYYFALSPTAIQSEIGMPRSTYYDQLKKLESLGFLEKDAKGYYHFYEVPKVYSNEKVSATENINADNGNGCAENGDGCTEKNIEINNKYNTQIKTVIDNPKAKGEGAKKDCTPQEETIGFIF